jgi:TfoX/Sxy family transcriptional regulator of competence genes
MNWRKAPESLAQAFEAALPADAAVAKRKMFGYPAAFVNGNMFAGVHQEDIVVRLPAERRSAAIESGARQFEPMPGRPMREYVVLSEGSIADGGELSRWLDEAFRFVAAMPAKEAKPRKKKA